MTPIKDYALIGNCETAALVGPQGSVDWLCLPAFDSPSIFAALLDKNGGSFSIQPAAPFRAEQSYLDDGAILVTRFVTDTSTVSLTDFLVTARRREARADDFILLHPARKLVRIVKLEGGTPVTMVMALQACPGYASRSARWCATGEKTFASEDALLTASFEVQAVEGDLQAHFLANEDAPGFCVLDFSDQRSAADVATCAFETSSVSCF